MNEKQEIVNNAVDTAKLYCSEEFIENGKFLMRLGEEAKQVETIPELMKLKVDGMLTGLGFPMGSESCPFCEIDEEKNRYDTHVSCTNCWYAEWHGGKCSLKESIYGKLKTARKDFRDCIKNYWTEEDSVNWDIEYNKPDECYNFDKLKKPTEILPYTLDEKNKEHYTFRGISLSPDNVANIRRYVDEKVYPGSFLKAIICKDLFEAVASADMDKIYKIPAYVGYFYNEVPSGCWGSEKKMDAWMGVEDET